MGDLGLLQRRRGYRDSHQQQEISLKSIQFTILISITRRIYY